MSFILTNLLSNVTFLLQYYYITLYAKCQYFDTKLPNFIFKFIL